MGNQVPSRRRKSGHTRTSTRRKDQPRRRKVAFVTLAAEAHCGRRGKGKGSGLRSLFRLGAVVLLLLAPLFIATTALGYATTLDPPPDSPYWAQNAPQAHGDPQRSGSSRVSLVDDPLDLQWTASGFAPFLAGAVMDDANAYVVDRKGVVVALNLTTGAEAWRVDLKQEVRATPALAYGWLYVATEAKELHALSAQSGTVIHKAKLAGAARAPPLVAEGRVFIGTEAGKLQVLDATNLDELWAFETSTLTFTNGTVDEKDAKLLKPIRAGAAAYDGVVYVAGWNARAYALTTTGNLHGNPNEMIWTRTLSDLVHAAPTVDRHRDLVYFATGDGRLEAWHRGSGTLSWWIDAGDSFTGSIAVNTTRLVAATTDGRLLGVAPDTGDVVWEHYEPSGYIASPTLLQDAVVTLSANGTLTLRDPETGKPLETNAGERLHWRLGDGAHASPAVTARGIIVVDQGGTVSLIGPSPRLTADLVAALSVSGETTTTKAFSVLARLRNEGPDLVPQVQGTMYRGDTVVDTITIERLAPGAVHLWTHNLSADEGRHTLRVVFTTAAATDPSPQDAAATYQVQVKAPATTGTEDGAIDLEELYGRDLDDDAPADASPGGFAAGVRAAWSPWMLPIGLFAALGGIFLGRYVRQRMARGASP